MPKKKHSFKFKSKKGQDVNIDYTPEGIKISDSKAFQGHLEKVTDLIQCTDYGVPKKEAKKEDKPKEPEQPKIKGIDEV